MYTGTDMYIYNVYKHIYIRRVADNGLNCDDLDSNGNDIAPGQKYGKDRP